MNAGQKSLAACVALALCAMVAGCGSSAGGSAKTPLSGNAGGNVNATQLTVYSSLPLAGGASTWAMSMVNAEKLALKQTRGQVGPFRISFYSEDDSTPGGLWDPAQTSAASRVAAQDHSTIAYLGDWDSGATAVSLPLMNGSAIPQVSPAASYPGLTRATFAGKGEPDRYYPAGRRSFVRLVPGDDVQAAALLSYMRREKVRRLYVITDHDVFAGNVAQILARLGPGHSLPVLGNETISKSDSEIAATTTRAAVSGADAVLFAGAPDAQSAKLLDALHHRLRHLKLFVPYQTATSGLLGQLGTSAAALYATTPAVPVSTYTGAAQTFARDYRQQFGTVPDPWAIYGYESMRLVLDAIRSAGSSGADHQSVVNQLFATGNRHSVIGTYTLDANGDTTLHRFAGERVRKGTLVLDAALATTPL